MMAEMMKSLSKHCIRHRALLNECGLQMIGVLVVGIIDGLFDEWGAVNMSKEEKER